MMQSLWLDKLDQPVTLPPSTRWLTVEGRGNPATWRVLAEMLARRPEVGLALPFRGCPDTECCELFPHLRALRVRCPGADLKGVRHLRQLRSLSVTSPASLAVLEGLPLPHLTVTQLGSLWNEVARLEELMFLDVLQAAPLDASCLTPLRKLSVLSLFECPLENGDSLARLPQLRSVSFNGVRSKHWDWLPRLSELRSLALCRLTALKALPELPPTLFHLMLGELPLADFDGIARLPNLRALELLTMKKITPEYFARLASRLSLEEFSYITDNPRKHAAMTKILNLPTFQDFDRNDCPFPFPADWPTFTLLRPPRSSSGLPLFSWDDEIFQTDI